MAKKKTVAKKGRLPKKLQAKAKAPTKNAEATSVTNPDFSTFVERAAGKKIALNIGVGDKGDIQKIHNVFADTQIWHEVTLNSIADVNADITSDIRKLAAIGAGQVDGIWAPHVIEHVFTHEVTPTFAEYRRILKPNAPLLLITPNLEQIAKIVSKRKLETTLYKDPNGTPVTALELIYGNAHRIAAGQTYMQHFTGFTSRTLANKLAAAGFGKMEIREDKLMLIGLAYNSPMPANNKPDIQFFDIDVNKIMAQRDELDQEPLIWKGFPPKD